MSVSIIIPVLNEEAILEEALLSLRREQGPHEIIVADGGSTDRSREIAARHAVLIRAAKGRANQMNEGARRATGDILLFLHADSRLPPGACRDIERAVRSGPPAGRFRLRFDHDGFLLKLYSAYTRFQCFSYGDQGFFVSRDLFFEMEGFNPAVPFEDLEFYKRLLARVRPRILTAEVTTSARRFLQMGTLRQKWINFVLVTLYYAGIDITRLKARLYPDIR